MNGIVSLTIWTGFGGSRRERGVPRGLSCLGFPQRPLALAGRARTPNEACGPAARRVPDPRRHTERSRLSASAMSNVLLRECSYEYGRLRNTIFAMLEETGGDLIRPGLRVVIKPNLLAPATPEKAMLTHPLVIRAVAEFAIAKGAKARISDSPALGSLQKVIATSGIRDALAGLNVECREFTRSVPVNVGPPFNTIELAEDAWKADVLINLPKLKTHTHMLLTLAVKNLFGCVVGARKPQWHFRAGINRDLFATLLVSIYSSLRPAISLVDGILAMEGQGPGRSGTPRPLGILAAGDDALAVDAALCRVFGMEPDELPTNSAARRMGLLKDPITVRGSVPLVGDFKLPAVTSLVFGPRPLHGFMRRHIAQRPAADRAACKLCGECWKYCPAHAIHARKGALVFDYEACIRCYCCIEVCPEGAILQVDTLTGKLMRRAIEASIRRR